MAQKIKTSDLPVSAALRRKLPGMSKQQRFQAVRIENGLCCICGREPLAGKRMGLKCAEAQRMRMARKQGTKGTYKSEMFRQNPDAPKARRPASKRPARSALFARMRRANGTSKNAPVGGNHPPRA